MSPAYHQVVAGVFVVLLGASRLLADPPPTPRVAVPAGSFAPGDRVELIVSGLPDTARPFDPAVIRLDAEIIAPGGQTIRVPGFAEPRCAERQISGETRYVPTGGVDWRVRFAASVAGAYRGTARVTTPDGQAVSPPFRFEITPSDAAAKGVVRVAPDNPRAFACADGTPFIPIGENLCWQRPRDKLYGWITKLGANGGNCTRVWTSSTPTFGLEGTRAYEYNEDAARGLDRFLQTCEQSGVRAIFCLNHVRSFGPPPRPPGAINYSFDYPYDVRNGGPAASMKEMFTLPAARVQQEAMLRYAIARWGYSRSVFAWELWNEMDSIRDNAAMRPEIVRWVDTMCRYLHENDPYHHLATTSLGSSGVWDDLWSLPSVDFVNYHDYGGREKYRDRSQVEVYAPVMATLSKFAKPVLFSEVGLVDEHWSANEHVSPRQAAAAVQDTGNRAFHEALWLPFFTGAAGGGIHWWWEEFDAYDAYPLYRPLAAFLADVPLARGPLPPVAAKTSADALQCFARGNEAWGTAAWVWDTRAAWQTLVVAGAPPVVVSHASVVFPGARGTFAVTCTDTRTGKELSRQTIQAGADGLTVPLPDFTVDVAFKAVRVP